MTQKTITATTHSIITMIAFFGLFGLIGSIVAAVNGEGAVGINIALITLICVTGLILVTIFWDLRIQKRGEKARNISSYSKFRYTFSIADAVQTNGIEVYGKHLFTKREVMEMFTASHVEEPSFFGKRSLNVVDKDGVEYAIYTSLINGKLVSVMDIAKH